MKIRVQNLDIAVSSNIPCRNDSFAFSVDFQHLFFIGVDFQREAFQVQNDLSYVLDHSWNRRELVKHSVDLNGCYCRARQRGQQNSAKRISKRRAISTLERFYYETPVCSILIQIYGLDFRLFDLNH
ncbi:hypothetical protein D3C84_1022980 [compost metagenome]